MAAVMSLQFYNVALKAKNKLDFRLLAFKINLMIKNLMLKFIIRI